MQPPGVVRALDVELAAGVIAPEEAVLPVRFVKGQGPDFAVLVILLRRALAETFLVHGFGFEFAVRVIQLRQSVGDPVVEVHAYFYHLRTVEKRGAYAAAAAQVFVVVNALHPAVLVKVRHLPHPDAVLVEGLRLDPAAGVIRVKQAVPHPVFRLEARLHGGGVAVVYDFHVLFPVEGPFFIILLASPQPEQQGQANGLEGG